MEVGRGRRVHEGWGCGYHGGGAFRDKGALCVDSTVIGQGLDHRRDEVGEWLVVDVYVPVLSVREVDLGEVDPGDDGCIVDGVGLHVVDRKQLFGPAADLGTEQPTHTACHAIPS